MESRFGYACSRLSLLNESTMYFGRPSLKAGLDEKLFTLRQYARFSIHAKQRYRARRTLLYVPGNDEKKIAKIPSLHADCAVMDCEDGVAQNRKSDARNLISKMLDAQNFGETECSVRINAIDTGLAEEDLKAVFHANRRPQSIVVPKVESLEHLPWIADKFEQLCKPNESTIRLIALIESAKSLLNLDQICQQARQLFQGTNFVLDALIFGSDDFCANIGATRTKEAEEVLYARQHLVVVAKAHQLQAIDMVYIDYKDLDGLERQCVKGAQMGFTGKQVIHPNQLPIVKSTFSPSAGKVLWAKELITAFEEHQISGKGAFTFRGSMIDMPLLRQAKNVIEFSQKTTHD